MSSASLVRDLSPAEIFDHWPQIESLIAPLLVEDGNYAPSDILRDHLAGKKKVWASISDGKIEAVMVTELHDYPRKRVCFVPWIAGTNLDNWADKFIAASEAYARGMGCKRMCGLNREGWVRVAGYSKAGALLYKDI